MIVFTLYTMVDGFFVARFVGEIALSSVNVAMPFINGLFGIAILFSVGTQTLVGVKLGERDLDGANRLFSFVTTSIFGFCIILTLLGVIFTREIAVFLGATELLMADVISYLRIIIIFSAFFIVSYNFEVMVKIDGFPVLATLSVVVSAITNIVLDYIFVGLMGRGVAGAAVATGLSQVVAACIYLYHFIFGKSRLSFVKLRQNFKIFHKIFRIGLGDFIAEIGVGLMIFLYNHFLLLYIGERAVASFSIINYTNQVVSMCYVGITQGIQPLTSYYLGMKRPDIYKKLFRYAEKSITVLSLLFVAIALIGAPQICTVFFGKSNAELIMVSAGALRLFSIAFLFSGHNILIAGFSAALMRPRYSISINIMRSFLFLAGALALLGSFGGKNSLWHASAVAEFITVIFAFIFIRRIWRDTENPYK